MIFSEFDYVTKIFYVPMFLKNIEKIWDIEKFCNIVKFRKKIKAKSTESQHLSMLKFLDGQALNLLFNLSFLTLEKL